MEGHCSTGQGSQRAVVPMEEEEEEDSCVRLILFIIHTTGWTPSTSAAFLRYH